MAVADLAILIKATDEASATLRSVGGLTRDLGSHAASSVTGFVSLSGAMAAGQIAASAFLGVAGGLISVFSSAATAATTFESKLSAIQAVSGATKQEMADLSAKALQLGKDTSFSASEAADGIAELSKAGVKVADIMGGAAKASLDLAAAGGVSVAEAAEIASNAMNVFNIKGADMAHVADQIAGAANASAIDVTDYKFSLSAAGAVAATVGVGFDDLTTSIALMGQAGIKGSDAGTSLKTMLLNLAPSTDKAAGVMKDLGIITKDGSNAFFDASGKAKSMSEIAGVLQHATAGLTEQQRLSALQTMFGTDAIRAAAIMAKAGAEGFDDMAASISKITAADVAKTRLDNLKGSMEAFKGSAETLAITIGIKLLPTFRAIVERGTALINLLIPLAEKIDLTAPLQATVDALGNVGTWLNDIANAIADFSTTTLASIPLIGPVFENIGVVIADMVGLVSDLLTGDMEQALEDFTDGWTIFGETAVTVWQAVVGVMRTAASFVTGTVVPVVSGLVGWLKDRLPPVLSWLSNTGWPMILSAMRAVAGFVTGTVVPAAGRIVDWLGDRLPPVLNWLINTGWPALLGAVRTVASFITGTVVPAITTLISWLADKVPPAVNSVLGAFQAVAGHLTPVVQAIFGGDLSAALAGLGSAFAAFATLALGWIGAQVARIDWQTVWARAVDVVSNMAQWFGSAASMLAGWIGSQVARIDWADVWARARDVASKMVAWFSDTATRIAGWIGDKVATIDWSGVWSRATNVAAKMAGWFTDVASRIAGWIGDKVAEIDWAGVWAEAVDVAAKMAQWFTDVATTFSGWISDKVSEIDWSGVWSKAVSVASSMSQWFATVATDFAGWLGEKIAEIDWGTLWSQAIDVSGHMAQWFTDTATKFTQWLGENVALIDWAGVWAKAVNAATAFTTWMTDTIAAMDWDAIGQYIGALLAWAAIEVIKVEVRLAAAMATWISDSITAAFNGDAENGPAGKFLKSLDGMIQAVKTGFIQLLIGMVRGAWDAAMAQFQPTMPAISAGNSTAPQSGNTSSGGSTVNLNQSGMSSANYGPIDNSSRAAFVKTAWPYMLDAAGGDRDLAEMMLAKAISENGDVGKGGSFIGNNFSGIKGKGSAGSFTAMTWEMVNGKRVNMEQEFAAYKTPQEGFAAFMNFLKDNSRYAGALAEYKKTGNANKLFEGINAAGYATDPDWASKVQNIRANQVAPITGGLSSNTSGGASSQSSQVVAGLQNINTALEATKTAYGATTQASVSFNNTLPNAKEALASVTATLQGQMAALHATGQADTDLVRDTIPTINQLEKQGTITGETATQLRSMALAVLGAGDATQAAAPDITAGTGAMDALGATIGVATENYGDLSDVTQSDVINPRVNTKAINDLSAASGEARHDLSIIDDVPISPVVNSQGIDAAKAAALAYANALAASDDTVITPQVNSAQIASGTLAAQGLGTAIQASDDAPSIPQVYTNGANGVDLADSKILGLGTHLLASDDTAAIPQVYTNGANGVDIASANIIGMRNSLLASDDVAAIPQVYTNGVNGVDVAGAAIAGMKAALLASDDTAALPQVYTNGANGVDLGDAAIRNMQTDLLNSDNIASVPQVDTTAVTTATSKVDTLDSHLDNLDVIHSLTFTGSAPSAVTVNNLTGTNTDLLGIGNIQGSKLQTNKIENAGNIQTGLIQTGFTFNFASGGRPPLGAVSMVGEMGPELFVPDTAGTIIPAGQTASILSGGARRRGGVSAGGDSAGGASVTINLTVSGNTMIGKDRAIAQQLARIIAPELARRVGV